MLFPWITTSRTSPRSTAPINSLKITSGSLRYCLLKTLKITKKTSPKTNQSAICFDDGLKKFSVQEKPPIASPALILALSGTDPQWKGCGQAAADYFYLSVARFL